MNVKEAKDLENVIKRNVGKVLDPLAEYEALLEQCVYVGKMVIGGLYESIRRYS